MRTAGAIGAAAVLLIAGCDDSPGGPGFSSLEDFSELPAFEELDYAGVTPARDYEQVVLKLVESCDPVRIDRFRLYVSEAGGLSVKASEVWDEDFGACI